MNMHSTASLNSIGQADPRRKERLLSIGGLLSQGRAGSAELLWPTSAEFDLEQNRRDLLPAAGTVNSGLLTFEQQVRQHSAAVRAGATVLALQSLQDSALPSIDRSKKATWVAAAADVAPTLDVTNSKPLRLSAYITVSKQLFATSPGLASAFVERQLLSAIGAALDDSALNGSGTNQPFGLANDPDLLTYDCTPTAVTLADLTEMERLLSAAHGEADSNALSWLVDPATRKALRAAPRIAAKEVPLWPDLAGYGPLGLRGTVSPWAAAGTLILGNFADLLIIQSGALELTSDPTRSEALAGFSTLIISGFFDLVALNPAHSFIRAI
jgi:HK97 family phage major capsid protein